VTGAGIKRSKAGYIYFVDAPTRHDIKIGWSRNPHSRFKVVQQEACVKLRLRGYFAAPIQHEKALHKYLNDRRMYGEWFATNQPMHRLVREMIAEKRVPAFILAETW